MTSNLISLTAMKRMFSLMKPGTLAGCAIAALAMAVSPGSALAQGNLLPPGVCDFDIADNLGRHMTGSTLRLTGRPGGSSNRGEFYIINGNTPEMDVDHDGYQVGCDYNDLYIPEQLRRNLINLADPALVIPHDNIIAINFPSRVVSGSMARVELFVEIPAGTVAGTYLGEIQVRDRVRGVSLGRNNELLGADRVFVEITVVEEGGFSIVDPEAPVELDSLVVRGRAGTTASGVMRIANTGNMPLGEVRVTATDLVAESATGLRITAENITITPAAFTALQVADTVRVTVSVRIPRGVLGGRYRGSLIVQGGESGRQEIPFVVIVTSSRGILFFQNPVRSAVGDIAQIAFNGDPGTAWRMGIFDMAGLLAYEATGTVYPGFGIDVTPGVPTGTAGPDGDFAVSVIWPLVNGRGEDIASGMYLVVVESIVNGQRQQAQNRLMVIR
jgi:hypothetical protein